MPAHPSPHCPTWPTPSNLPFFGFYSHSIAYTKASLHLGRGEAKGLIRQFLKTKELDIWLLLASLLPSSQLQNKPEPCSAPLLSPRPGERCQRRGRWREREALGDGMGAYRAPFLHRNVASRALHLRRGRPKALVDLNGRPYRGARVSETEPRPAPLPACAGPPAPAVPRREAHRSHTLGDTRRQPASARHRDRSRGRPAAHSAAARSLPAPRCPLTRPSPSRTAGQEPRTGRLRENGGLACTETAERCRVPGSAPRPPPLPRTRWPGARAPCAPVKLLP